MNLTTLVVITFLMAGVLAFVLPALWVWQKIIDSLSQAWEEALREELCDDDDD